MGEAIDRLKALREPTKDDLMVALAGLGHVKSYFRRSKSGKQVHVSAHKRSQSSDEYNPSPERLAERNKWRADMGLPLLTEESAKEKMREFDRRAGIETPEQKAAREASNEKIRSEFNAKSAQEQWESVHAAWRQSVIRELEKSANSKTWALDDDDTAHAVGRDKELLQKLKSGAKLTDAQYKHLMGMVRALDD